MYPMVIATAPPSTVFKWSFPIGPTPSYHPFIDGTFHEIKHPASSVGSSTCQRCRGCPDIKKTVA